MQKNRTRQSIQISQSAGNHFEMVRLAIQSEFVNRCKKNSAYSLRAFSRYLEVDQSFLSKLLKGKRRITGKLAATIGPKLGLKPEQLKQLFTINQQTIDFFSLSDDQFELISEWYHFAILELVKTAKFDAAPARIANRLGIHVTEVRDALARLERLGFIKITDSGIELLSPNNSWTNTSLTSSARRKLQKKLLEKSLQAIDEVPFELRDNSSLTVAVNTQRILEFKEKLKEIRRELAEFFQANGEQGLNEVYQLTISLFPVSQNKFREET